MIRLTLTALPLCAGLACAAPQTAPPMRWDNRPARPLPPPPTTYDTASTPTMPPPAKPPTSTTADSHSHSPHAHHDHTSGMHMDFSNAAHFARAFDDPERDASQKPDEVIARLGLEPGSVVVDLGSGTGYFVPRLSRAVGPSGKVLALDVEPNMVEHVRERARKAGLANVESRKVPYDDPELAPASVDRVLIVNTWHHIDRRVEYARKLARALKPNGELWIVDFTLEAPHGPPAQHRLTAQQVVNELEQGSLVAEVVEPEGLPDQYLVRGRLRPARR
jgi:ubiquinone/menaquinone biosynthesis C-methylase UbiE